MPRVRVNGIDIEYETRGDPANESVLLIMGYGMQLVHWPDEFVDQLVERGYHVIRFDNRDTGLSTKHDGHFAPHILLTMLLGRLNLPLRTPYTLNDMAQDAVALLEALGIDRAHIVGASMGGMIAQLVAARHPHRTRSLTSIMSTTGHRSLPMARPEVLKAMTTPPPHPSNFEAYLNDRIRFHRTIGSPGYPIPEEVLRERISRAVRRSFYPQGLHRQLAAIVAAPHRRKLLRRVVAPASVVHGEDDPLVRVEGGLDTAKQLPNAELTTIPGMGHDLPPALIPQIIDCIDRAAFRSRVEKSTLS